MDKFEALRGALLGEREDARRERARALDRYLSEIEAALVAKEVDEALARVLLMRRFISWVAGAD